MARLRISTTVDAELLQRARDCFDHAKDSTVMEHALVALIAEHRAAEIDRRIDIGYGDIALERPDEWGDLRSFLDAATEAGRATGPR